MVGWVRQRDPRFITTRVKKEDKFFYGILLWGGKNILLLETDLSRPTRRRTTTLLLFGLAFPWHAGTEEKREIWQSHRPVQKSIREIGGGGWVEGGVCGRTYIRLFPYKDCSNRSWGEHAPDHSHLHLLLKNAKWPSARGISSNVSPIENPKKRSQPKTRADLVNWGHLCRLLKTKFTIEKKNFKKLKFPIPMYFTIQP